MPKVDMPRGLHVIQARRRWREVAEGEYAMLTLSAADLDATMAELADAPDLGSGSPKEYRFESY